MCAFWWRLALCLGFLTQAACSSVTYHTLESSLKPTVTAPARPKVVHIAPSDNPKDMGNTRDRRHLEKVLTDHIQRQPSAFTLTSDAAKADYVLTVYGYEEQAGYYFDEEQGRCFRDSGNIDVIGKLLVPIAMTSCEQKLSLKVENRRCEVYDYVWSMNVRSDFITLWMLPLFPVNWLVKELSPTDKNEVLGRVIEETLHRIVANQGHYDRCESASDLVTRNPAWFPSPDRYLPECREAGWKFKDTELRFKAIDERSGYMEKIGGQGFECLQVPGKADKHTPSCVNACPGKKVVYKYGTAICSDSPGFRCRRDGFGVEPGS